MCMLIRVMGFFVEKYPQDPFREISQTRVVLRE